MQNDPKFWPFAIKIPFSVVGAFVISTIWIALFGAIAKGIAFLVKMNRRQGQAAVATDRISAGLESRGDLRIDDSTAGETSGNGTSLKPIQYAISRGLEISTPQAEQSAPTSTANCSLLDSIIGDEIFGCCFAVLQFLLLKRHRHVSSDVPFPVPDFLMLSEMVVESVGGRCFLPDYVTQCTIARRS